MSTTKLFPSAVGMNLPPGYPTDPNYPPPPFKLAAEAPSVKSHLDDRPTKDDFTKYGGVNKRKRKGSEQADPKKKRCVAGIAVSQAAPTPAVESIEVSGTGPRKTSRPTKTPARYQDSTALAKATRIAQLPSPPMDMDTEPATKLRKKKRSNPPVLKSVKAGVQKNKGENPAGKFKMAPAPFRNTDKAQGQRPSETVFEDQAFQSS